VIDKLLATLALKGEMKAGDLKLSPATEKKATIERLVSEGLLTVRKEGRSELVALTDAGRERAATLPTVPARAPRAAPPKAADLAARLDRIEAALARIEGRLGGGAAAPADLKKALLEVIAEVDAARRYGGLVPLPDIRKVLRERGITASDAEVNGALEELEREFTIDLSVAQSPTAVEDRGAGIERPGRGLAYYVLRRQV
jgi:hypothetical protein